jgi:hypothetical protein
MGSTQLALSLEPEKKGVTWFLSVLLSFAGQLNWLRLIHSKRIVSTGYCIETRGSFRRYLKKEFNFVGEK